MIADKIKSHLKTDNGLCEIVLLNQTFSKESICFTEGWM